MTDECESTCPYCNEPVQLEVDRSGGLRQNYVEDCPVCCRPWQVVTRWSPRGECTVELRRLDD